MLPDNQWLGKRKRRQNVQKNFFRLAIVITAVVLTASTLAADDRWEIRIDPYNNRSNSRIDSSDNRINPYSTDIEMRRKYDYDPSNKFRGTIDNDGYTRMRDYNGNIIRGNIENDGYGRLRDQDGNTYRVKPKW